MSSEEPHSRQSDSYQSSLPDPWPILNDAEKSFARTFVGMGFPTPRVARAVQRLGTNEKEVRSRFCPSSETQGQLVGTTGFSWAKVYNKSGRAPGHLLLPNEFQKRLKSRLLIGQKNIFLANQRRGTAGRLSCLLTRGCSHRTP